MPARSGLYARTRATLDDLHNLAGASAPGSKLRSVPKPDPALRARQAAAHEILSGDDRIDGPLLLSLVVWPTADLEQAATEAPLSKSVTPEQVERIHELAEAGLSWTAIAEQVLGSRRRKSTVGTVLRTRREAAA
jgi:hypothetical protein